jgi:hypothetical protein
MIQLLLKLVVGKLEEKKIRGEIPYQYQHDTFQDFSLHILLAREQILAMKMVLPDRVPKDNK